MKGTKKPMNVRKADRQMSTNEGDRNREKSNMDSCLSSSAAAAAIY